MEKRVEGFPQGMREAGTEMEGQRRPMAVRDRILSFFKSRAPKAHEKRLVRAFDRLTENLQGKERELVARLRKPVSVAAKAAGFMQTYVEAMLAATALVGATGFLLKRFRRGTKPTNPTGLLSPGETTPDTARTATVAATTVFESLRAQLLKQVKETGTTEPSVTLSTADVQAVIKRMHLPMRSLLKKPGEVSIKETSEHELVLLVKDVHAVTDRGAKVKFSVALKNGPDGNLALVENPYVFVYGGKNSAVEQGFLDSLSSWPTTKVRTTIRRLLALQGLFPTDMKILPDGLNVTFEKAR